MNTESLQRTGFSGGTPIRAFSPPRAAREGFLPVVAARPGRVSPRPLRLGSEGHHGAGRGFTIDLRSIGDLRTPRRGFILKHKNYIQDLGKVILLGVSRTDDPQERIVRERKLDRPFVDRR